MMKVYISRKRNLMGQMTPIVIETNIEFALPYWTKRKQSNPNIFWEFV
jgi:hypothetical protein